MTTFFAVAGGIIVANLVMMLIGFLLFTNEKIVTWITKQYLECIKECESAIEEFMEEKL